MAGNASQQVHAGMLYIYTDTFLFILMRVYMRKYRDVSMLYISFHIVLHLHCASTCCVMIKCVKRLNLPHRVRAQVRAHDFHPPQLSNGVQ